MLVGLKIVADVVGYRVRKLEMGNLPAATSIALALYLPLQDIVARTAFAFVLNVLVYLNNDYVDVDIDLASTDKDNAKTRFLAAHKRAALVSQWVLVALLTAAALAYDRGLFVALIGGGGICVWYSAYLKRRPFVDILAMAIWGVTMPLCGSPAQSTLGWGMALQLGLVSGVFETIQVMRDADEDAKDEGVRTTGVVLGQARTLLLARALMLATSLYAALVMHPAIAVLSAFALVVPFTKDDVALYWTRVKLVYGVTWLSVCALVFLQGHTAGLWWSIGHAAGQSISDVFAQLIGH
ncbi:MAG TPA: UbiA family prenyltransferase [Polyangiales bacterium]